MAIIPMPQHGQLKNKGVKPADDMPAINHAHIATSALLGLRLQAHLNFFDNG
jgi:hypothetical protein